MMNRTYAVVENTFANDTFKIRFAGEKSEPVFVAKDIVEAMGYKNATVTTRNLPGRQEIDRTAETGYGNHIMVGITFDDVEKLLGNRHQNKKVDGVMKFRKFWNEEVTPKVKYPEVTARCYALQQEKAGLEAEVERLKAELELYKTGKIRPILNETA